MLAQYGSLADDPRLHLSTQARQTGVLNEKSPTYYMRTDFQAKSAGQCSPRCK